MRIGLIGFGSIGERHYRNLSRMKQEITVFSHRADTRLGGKQVHTWREFCRRAPYAAVFITNETGKHLATIRKVLTLKPRAIFVEKPLSHSVRGLKGLKDLLERAHISLFVGYCLQFFTPLRYVKKLLERGKLGKVHFMRVSVGQDLRGWKRRDYAETYAAKRSSGGGVMLDLIHDINYPAWLLGEKLLPRGALIKTLSSLQIETEDIAESLFVTEKSGIVVSVHQDYLRIPGKRTLEIVGSLGNLSWDSLRNEVIVEGKVKSMRKKMSADRNDMYQRESAFFLRQVKKGRYFSNFDEALWDVKMVAGLKKLAKW